MQGWKRGGAPLWASACEMSEVWGVPPWEIWERPGAARWINRMQIYQVEAQAARTKGPLPSLGPTAPDDITSFNGDIPVAIMTET